MLTTDVFVYGTLKPGAVNHAVCDRFVVATQPAIAHGRLYHLPFGYPAMTLDQTGIVHGFILSFADPAILEILDEFEQHDPLTFHQIVPERSLAAHQYHRVCLETFTPRHSFLADAWGYTMTVQQIHALGGIEIVDGNWRLGIRD